VSMVNIYVDFPIYDTEEPAQVDNQYKRVLTN
jgi:hypothetical protein